MRLLFIEDEPRLLRSVAKSLREEGYAVDTAADGDDALFKAQKYNYDAIVLDVMLPVLDGRAVERFYRGDKARSNTGGQMGLGLAISKTIVELHRGSIAVRSQIGEGSAFTLRIPVYRIK